MVLFEANKEYVSLPQRDVILTPPTQVVPPLEQDGTKCNNSHPNYPTHTEKSDTGTTGMDEENSLDLPSDLVDLDFRRSSLCSQRTSLEKILLVLLLLSGIVIISLSALFISYSAVQTDTGINGPSKVRSSTKEDTNAHDSKVCTTSGCVGAAADLLAAMDPSVDPCEDFFTFACGQWNRLHPIPEDEAGYGTFRMVRDKLRVQLRMLLEGDRSLYSPSTAIKMSRIAYDSCNDLESIALDRSTRLLESLSELGHWPLINRGLWKRENFDLTKMISRLKTDYAADIFITIYVYADGKNTSRNILYIDQGTLGLQARDYYLNDTIFRPQLDAYRDLFFETVQLLARDANVSLPSNLNQLIDNIITFEKDLANITSSEEKRRNATRMYNKWTITELKRRIPQIDWDLYFKYVMPPEVQLKMSPDTQVIIQEPDYLHKVAKYLSSVDQETIVNYMLWRVVKLWSKVLDSRFEDIIQNFLRIMVGRQQKPPRWKSCVMATVGWFDMATGSLYVDEHFNTADKTEALSMIHNLQKAFEELVLELDWMDKRTKDIAIQKAEAMILHIGYPDLVKNATAMDAYYNGLHLNGQDSYFDIAKKIAVWAQNKELKELLKPFDRTKFDISPAVVNAFYSPEKNAITFPAGILQPPFFRGDYPKSVNYGAMGAVIGHEITHGFDDQGSQYDMNGNLQNWWSTAAFKGFYTRTQCMVKQYSNYVVPEINMKVNGMLTQGENIADNGGIKEAYKAYRKHVHDLGHEEPLLPGLNLTNDQIFFLSFANFWCGHKKEAAAVQQVLTDPHSPEMFRVIGVMTNSMEFAEAYNCKEGSLMNPPKSDQSKCEVW